jgi:type IV secretion system protein VirB9
MRRLAITALALVCFGLPAGARTSHPAPAAEPSDHGLLVFDYDPDRIVMLQGHLGYQMMIAFGADERIENVSIGDSLGWQVTPNRAATILFVKPIARHAATNMNVVTSKRLYSFDLRAGEARGPTDPAIIYRVSFRYPAPATPPAAQTPPPPNYNFHYSFSGDRTLAPLRVFDDGHATYFQFAPNSDAPAIFVLDSGQEEVANAQARGDFLVVDRLAGDFALRYGRRRTVVHNEANAAAPQSMLPQTGAPR